jgi:hypothetical protein
MGSAVLEGKLIKRRRFTLPPIVKKLRESFLSHMSRIFIGVFNRKMKLIASNTLKTLGFTDSSVLIVKIRLK